MTFRHELLPVTELESVTHDYGGRFYTCPDGSIYPSVTTVLGGKSADYLDDDPEWKDKWVAKVGTEEAAAVSRRATARGTALHSVAEKFLMNETLPDLNYALREDFKRLRPLLENNVSRIRGVEIPLHSHVLRTAGRDDVLADWKGVTSVLDFKTSLRIKTVDQIKKYFVQTACYAVMAEEMYGLNISQLVIAMIVDHDEPLVFVERASDWYDDVERVYFQRENYDEVTLGTIAGVTDILTGVCPG